MDEGSVQVRPFAENALFYKAFFIIYLKLLQKCEGFFYTKNLKGNVQNDRRTD